MRALFAVLIIAVFCSSHVQAQEKGEDKISWEATFELPNPATGQMMRGTTKYNGTLRGSEDAVEVYKNKYVTALELTRGTGFSVPVGDIITVVAPPPSGCYSGHMPSCCSEYCRPNACRCSGNVGPCRCGHGGHSGYGRYGYPMPYSRPARYRTW